MMWTEPEFAGLGVAHNFCNTWKAAGGDRKLMHAIVEDPRMVKEFVRISKGEHDSFPYTVYADDDPQCREDAKVIKHLKMGTHVWDPDKIALVDAERYYGSARLSAEYIAVGDITIDGGLNAIWVEFLLKYQGRIPEDWKKLLWGGNKILSVSTIILDAPNPPYANEPYCKALEYSGSGRFSWDRVKYVHKGHYLAVFKK